MNPARKKGFRRFLRILLILLTIVIVFNELLFAGMLMIAYADMRHEGATYSQWYESSIDGYYTMLLVFILHSELTLAVWMAIRRRIAAKKESVKKKNESCLRKMPWWCMLAVCAALAVMTAMTANLFMENSARLTQEIADREWPLAGRYCQVGEARIACVMTAQAFAVSVWMLFVKRKQDGCML